MLSGVKFISREELNNAPDDTDDVLKDKKLGDKDKKKKKKKKPSASFSSSDDDLYIKKEGRKKKRWYSSDESSPSSSSDDGKKRYSVHRGKKEEKSKRSKNSRKGIVGDHTSGSEETHSPNDNESVRKGMGLEWMITPEAQKVRKPSETIYNEQEKASEDELKKANPKELNPYFKNNGSGNPEVEMDKAGGYEHPSSSVVGDGGASWRLKALKRAQEQAAREGKKLDEVVGERWGSLGQLAVSVSSRRAAPSRAHLHAIKHRRRGLNDEDQYDSDSERQKDKKSSRDYLKDVSARHPEMREPKVLDSLSWGKRKGQNVSSKDAAFLSSAVSGINKFENDGNFMREFIGEQSNESGDSVKENKEKSDTGGVRKTNEDSVVVRSEMSLNQMAAKALQLQLKGQHEEAQRLLKELEDLKSATANTISLSRPQVEASTARCVYQDPSNKKREDDSDKYLAERIMRNKQYGRSGQADDEYDYEAAPSRKSRKNRGADDQNANKMNTLSKRILTQAERCSFCFENQNRPKHLVVSIANFTYLMLPQWQPIVPGHCCILTMQHESATRTVDKNVWEEIRNFKKCLIMMFGRQEKELVFLETVMDLAKQRRHCLIECIPIPSDVAKEAPLYFKKAIDEAEEEWSQHNAKKLIDTSVKGLRGSIPEHFPYFHVEFGLNKGFVHVIDDEKQFKSSFGLNVLRGMLRLPEEDMHRRRKYESVEVQREAVANFAQDWKPFDWTKQL